MEASVEGKAGENRHAKEHRQPVVTEKAGPASQHPPGEASVFWQQGVALP